MILIGLTGGIACGKSSVSSYLDSSYHFHIIDADRIVHQLQTPGSACVRSIAKRWPQCVDATTGALDRAALGQVVFADPSARRALGAIMNGPIFRAIVRDILSCWWRSLRGDETCHIVILDAPTLFETRVFTRFISSSVVVACSEARQVQRLAQRNGLPQDDAMRRIQSQMPLAKKRALAGYVIENDSENDVRALEAEVDKCVRWMKTQHGWRLTSWVVGGALTCVAVGAVAVGVVLKLLQSLRMPSRLQSDAV